MRQLVAPSDVKVAVYAICKNESAFVEQWIANMWNGGQGADQVFVLDTGSTDDTLEVFQSTLSKLNIPKEWLQLKQQVVTPWRFDVARNVNLKMVPTNQYDALYCIDLDELVIEDFWTDLKEEVFKHPNFDRIYYRYAWSHNSEGDPDWVFWYDKIHGGKGGWKWEYPVHETLTCLSRDSHSYEGCYYLDSSKIYLHHYPDLTKSRSSYLGLLELRAEEHPEDLYGLFYLAREHSFKSDWKNCITTATGLYIRLLGGNPPAADLAAIDDMGMLPAVAALIGDGYLQLGLRPEAEFFYERSIKHGPSYRAGYIKLAQLQAWEGRSADSLGTLHLMEKSTIRSNDWREVPLYWRAWKIKQIEADALCWEGKYQDAWILFTEALQEIETLKDRQLAISENFFSDYNWCANQLGC